MIRAPPGTRGMMQLSSGDTINFIQFNFKNPQNFPKVRTEIGPNMGPGRYQTTSDHQSEAVASKIDKIEASDSPGLTLPS